MMRLNKKVILELMMQIAIEAGKSRGKGTQYAKEVDNVATNGFDELMNLIPVRGVLSIEGERDGISGSKLQQLFKKNNNSDNGYLLSIDPIDGTTALLKGMSRSNSALVIWRETKKKYKKVPDTLSCFYVASNKDKKFLDNLCVNDKEIGNFRKANNYKEYKISTLHRSESESLWKNILGIDDLLGEIGENGFYLPNMKYENIFFAGDASITLPVESDCFIGRVGSSEARIEGALWKYWRGVLVSGKKMKNYSGGALQYMLDRIKLAQNGEGDIRHFFEQKELTQLEELEWSEEEIARYIEKNDFVPSVELLIVASISGTKDNRLKEHSDLNLSAISKSKKELYEVEYVTVTNNKPCFRVKQWKGKIDDKT